MTYFYVQDMHETDRDMLLDWVVAEGLNPAAIHDNGRFSVHNGRVSGELFVINPTTNQLLYHKNEAVTVPFNREQINPLPEELQ